MPSDRQTAGVEHAHELSPFACSVCGAYLSQPERLAGRDHCTDHRG